MSGSPKKTTAWLQENNAFGPKHEIVPGLGGAVEKITRKGRNFTMIMGSSLTKSGTPVAVTSWGDEIYVNDLTEEQLKNSGIKSGGCKVSELGVVRDRVSDPVPITISTPTITGGSKVDGSKELKGELSIDQKEAITDKVNVSVRISYTTGEIASARYCRIERNAPAKGKVAFTFPAFNPGKEKRVSGPVVVVFDLCVNEDASKDETLVVSKPKVVVIDVE